MGEGHFDGGGGADSGFDFGHFDSLDPGKGDARDAPDSRIKWRNGKPYVPGMVGPEAHAMQAPPEHPDITSTVARLRVQYAVRGLDGR